MDRVFLFPALMTSVICLFFFFSSRRRHTRLQGDWSSDVCSSDLAGRTPSRGGGTSARVASRRSETARRESTRSEERRVGKECRSRWSPDQYKKKKKQRCRQQCRRVDGQRTREGMRCSREQRRDKE